MKIKIAATLVAMIAILSFSYSAWAQTAGSITALSGTVTIYRAGRSITATDGTPVQVGDRLVTAANSRVTITLTDKSQIELAELGTLVITQNLLTPSGSRQSTGLTLLGGLLHSLVRVTAGTPPNFKVYTPNAVASARGTAYDTSYESGKRRKGYKDCRRFTDVEVFKGTVEVSSRINPGAPPVEVTAGHKTTVACGYAPTAPVAIAATSSGLPLWVGTALGTGIVGGGIATGLILSGGGNNHHNNRHPISPQ